MSQLELELDSLELIELDSLLSDESEDAVLLEDPELLDSVDSELSELLLLD